LSKRRRNVPAASTLQARTERQPREISRNASAKI